MCCGPCSCYPVKRLREIGYEPVGYFFNPNIHPYREFIQRIETAKEFASKSDMEIIVDDNYQLRDFLTRALSAEAEDANGRCQMCYTWRLEQAAAFAKELKKPGLFQIPGLVKIEKKTIPAQKAIKDWKNPFTGEIGTKPAKPASTKVKVRALKKLKDMA